MKTYIYTRFTDEEIRNPVHVIETIKELEAGDIVFFNTNKRDGDICDHSGLYIGEGNFIHCSSAKGKVIISTLEEGYYNEVFSWGRRIKEVRK